MNNDLISRSALIERCKVIADCEWNHRAAPFSWADAYEAFADMAEDAPAVDAVEVVRCKDCKHSGMYAFGCGSKEQLACLEIEEDGFVGMASAVDPNGFCSAGERRTDE